MSFAASGYLALLALAPLAAAGYLALARWRRRAARRFAPERERAALDAGASPHLRAAKAALVVLALALVAVALARPQIGAEHLVVERSGADVVIALDVSRSMFADDVVPSRLGVAQEETLTLLDRLPGHRIGLVIFARSALLRSPLTTDASPLRALVEAAPGDSVLLAPGSDLGAALRAGMVALEAGDAESKAIVLVSDGEDHEGAALAAAQEAASRGVRIYASGVGTEAGAPVPEVDPETGLPQPGTGGATGQVTRLDEALLRTIVASTPGGAYVPGERLAELAGPIGRLERTTFASERQELPVERFQWLVLAALTLLVVEQLLPERRLALRGFLKRVRLAPTPAVLALLVLAGAACSSAADGLIEEGNEAYGRGDLAAALEAYRRAGADDPGRAEAAFNAGLALHRLERYEEAALETLRALPIEDAREAASAHYNLGNHYVALGRLEEAFASYRRALVLQPDDRDAKHNLELVRLLMLEQSGEGMPVGQRPEDSEPGDESEPTEGDATGPAAAQQALAEALGVVDGDLTVDEALRALQLAQELNRLLPLQEGARGTAPGGLDY